MSQKSFRVRQVIGAALVVVAVILAVLISRRMSRPGGRPAGSPTAAMLPGVPAPAVPEHPATRPDPVTVPGPDPAPVRPDGPEDAPPEVVAPLTGEHAPGRPSETNAAARPPDMDEPEPPASMAAQINSFVRQAASESGPEAVKLGQQLLESDNPVLRAAGVAVLSANDALDAETLAEVAKDPASSVPVNALGWLRDIGEHEMADSLSSMLPAAMVENSALIDLLYSGTLNGSGSRAALELLQGSLSPEEATDLYGQLSADSAQDYAVRMKSAVLLRETMEFAEYRDTINAMAANAAVDDALWGEGISRLATRLEGPIPVHEGPASLTPSDVDEMLAREYPMTLEDLAQRIEYVTGEEDAYVQKGTADRLVEQLESLSKRPWTEEQQVSLQRLQRLAEQLPALETSDPPPPSVPEPPPGAVP